MTSSRFILLFALSIQGGRIGTRRNVGHGDGNRAGGDSVVMGLAVAFSPAHTTSPRLSSVSSSLVAAIVGGRVPRAGERWVHREMTGAHHASSDSNTNGDADGIAGSTENQYTSVRDDDDDGGMISANDAKNGSRSRAERFDEVVNARYACTRFQRYREPQHDGDGEHEMAPPAASLSDKSVVRTTHECLASSRRAPTGFNAQPYRVVLVHSPGDKARLAEYCLGRNADRVRDSDCTAVFLADRECGRDGRRFADFLVENMDDGGERKSASRTRRPLSSRALLKLRILILLFSSGYPLPRFLAVPLSFGVRLGVTILSFVMRMLHSVKKSVQLLPTLSSAETWSQKNTMLVAMAFMLSCTSRGLATCPMEGFDAGGVRKALGIPRGRYSIPLIASVGTPYHRREEEEETDDVGLSHSSTSMSPRFPLEEVVYGNAFGEPFVAT